MPLGSDATEQMPTDNWTELAHQTPASQVRLSEWSNAYSLPDSYEQGMPGVTDSLSLGDHPWPGCGHLQNWKEPACGVPHKKAQSENDMTDLQALADKEGDSIKSGTAWMCLLCGNGPHDIGQALWAVLPNALSHMPRHRLHYIP